MDYGHFSNFSFLRAKDSTWNLSNIGLAASEKSFEILNIFPYL